MSDHKHQWKVDYSMPTSDVYPVHRDVYCECGATACREDGTGFVHDLIDPRPAASELVEDLQRESPVAHPIGGDGGDGSVVLD